MTDHEPYTGKQIAARAVSAALPQSLGGAGISSLVNDIIYNQQRRARQAIEPALDAVGEGQLAELLLGSEALEVLIHEALQAAARSSDEQKRRLLGRVVREAVIDDALIDQSSLVVRALRDLDALHIRTLRRMLEAADEADQAAGGSPDSDAGAMRTYQMGLDLPTPVVATLIQTGVVYPQWFHGSGTSAYGVTPFGRQLLASLAEAH